METLIAKMNIMWGIVRSIRIIWIMFLIVMSVLKGNIWFIYPRVLTNARRTLWEMNLDMMKIVIIIIIISNKNNLNVRSVIMGIIGMNKGFVNLLVKLSRDVAFIALLIRQRGLFVGLVWMSFTVMMDWNLVENALL